MKQTAEKTAPKQRRFCRLLGLLAQLYVTMTT